jgi:phenylacetate-coenzyme A ligase PaaK-like adenylate-forming protein
MMGRSVQEWPPMWPASNPWESAAAFADALAVTYAPATAWQARRDTRLAALLARAASASPLYRKLLAPVGGEAAHLVDVPPMRKAALMGEFGQWVTDPEVSLAALHDFTRDPERIGQPFLGRYTVWESSGSCGEPAVFVLDERAMAAGDALEAARGPVATDAPSAWLRGWPGTLRLAFVGAVDGHFASIVSLQRARRLNPWLDASLRTFSFLQPLGELVAALDAWQPSVLSSYPSMAWVLAQEQAAGRLHLNLQSVWTGGETLGAAQRDAITHAFGAPVRDSYGASECLTIASECRRGHLHLNADWVILEPVDAEWRPVAAGEVGTTTLVTHLASHVQPVIRYELGDRVRVVPGACGCGSTLPMIEVQGRCDDVLTLRGAQDRPVHLAPLALTTVLEEQGGVFDFELVQTGERSLELLLHGEDGSEQHLQGACRALRGWLRTQGLPRVRLQARCPGFGAARGRSGKQRRVRCLPRLTDPPAPAGDEG